jgi:hypothetical protein
MGCGPGVYVPRHAVEVEVCQGLSGLLSVCADPHGFTGQVNTELRRLWEDSTGRADSIAARKEIERVEAKIGNIRRAIEDGLADAPWANSRLRELTQLPRSPVGSRRFLEARSLFSAIGTHRGEIVTNGCNNLP